MDEHPLEFSYAMTFSPRQQGKGIIPFIFSALVSIINSSFSLPLMARFFTLFTHQGVTSWQKGQPAPVLAQAA